MVVLLLVWIVLGFTSFAWGSAFMALTKPYPQERLDTNIFFARLWCGVVMQAAAALGLSLAGPVSARRVLLFSLAVCLASVLNPTVRLDARHVWQSALAWGWRDALVAMVPATAAALFFSQAPSNYDTLLYHHQLTKWFAEFGAVKGLALIHERFGFLSSTFALAAPLESVLPGRSATAVNGFLLCLAAVQACRMVPPGRSSTSFARTFFLVGVVGVITLHSALWEPTSATPDFAAAVVAVAAVWLLLHEDPGGQPLVAAFVVACGLPLIKLSTLPAAALIAVVALSRLRRGRQGRLVVPLGYAGLSAMGFVAVSFMITGALLFPMAVTSIDVRWGLGADATRGAALEVRDWARWGGPSPETTTTGAWLSPWLRSGKGILFCGLASGNLLLLAWVPRRVRERAGTGGLWVVALSGIVTSAYIFSTAPNPRFGLGLLSLGWFGLAALAAGRLRAWSHGVLPVNASTRLGWVATSIAALLVVVSLWPVDSWRRALNASRRQPLVAAATGRFNWLMPGAVPSIAFVRRRGGGAASAFTVELRQDRVDGFVYYHPINTDICGPAPLPAAPRPLTGVSLAYPSRGLAGGFVRDRQ